MRRSESGSPPLSGGNGHGGRSGGRAWPTCARSPTSLTTTNNREPAEEEPGVTPLDEASLQRAPAFHRGAHAAVRPVRPAHRGKQRLRRGPAAQGGGPGPARAVHARLADRGPHQAPGVAGRHRHGHRRCGGPGRRARDRPDRPRAADLHHRAAGHAGARRARQPQPCGAGAAALGRHRAYHGRARRRARGRPAERRDRLRPEHQLGHRAHRHRGLRGRR